MRVPRMGESEFHAGGTTARRFRGMMALVNLVTLVTRPLRERATVREAAYHLWGAVAGVWWFVVALTAYSVSLVLSLIWVGIPMLVATHHGMRLIAETERGAVRRLLAVDLPPLPPAPHERGDNISALVAWVHEVMADIYAWRAAAWVLVRVILGPVGAALTVGVIAVWLALVSAPAVLLFPQVGLAGPLPGLAWTALAGPLMAVVMAPILAWVIRGWAALMRVVARLLLGPCAAELTKAATTRAERAEQQVRIDQELHDSIGHMITMNIVQAGAGAHVFDSDPQFARQALRNIEERGRAAMAELDRIIATLRGDDVPRAPLPHLGDLSTLVDASRAAGLDVSLATTAGALPEAVSRTAYAVVREAVTNAAKHAPGAWVHIHIDDADDAVAVTVTNGAAQRGGVARTGHDMTGGGHGLDGIRHRVHLLGGRCDAGPTPDGGYAVAVLIPRGAYLDEALTPPQHACCGCAVEAPA